MTIRVAINGFGRIGRMVLRALAESNRQDIQIVAINDLGSAAANAHLLQYDSVHGRFPRPIHLTDQTLDIGFGPIHLLAEPNPEKLPWAQHNIDLVFECSGRFTKRDDAAKHLTAGAKRVLISAPAEGADITVVYGVNHQQIQKEHLILSNASCTTNCLAPLASVLHQAVGIECGYMTTIHSYTGDQRIVDTLHSDPRRARAAGLSMIPTSTGAAKAVGLVLPDLKGKLDGTSIRVPTANVSVVDFTFNSLKPTTATAINDALKQAAQGPLKGILAVVDVPLVSCDFNHDSHSSIVDLDQTQVVGDKFCRVLSWYDNEWGFSNRMLDVALVIKDLDSV
ncbi:type I glyceraldehyde-3-phosphate dehydrogenase [Candidatus Finniella inopinata]|uniref:Glyceraldehyde-3-phosphate dehydrogenase n=1 Tax=Candidatus Finniella inopinata TaxID=1696036 RepID=A0A4Q7DIR0_9PROT|nr:type I glyceraldehyde-3-phosphate dehydrogenase [Candidatus Finniella inopinata]RZI46861.1 type I glyceraldehyde-3-phosphate dehydrogenase [Candidatus Finniella inopinata]